MDRQFTPDELHAIAFFAYERIWRARLAVSMSDLPVPERAAYACEITQCERIQSKADAIRLDIEAGSPDG